MRTLLAFCLLPALAVAADSNTLRIVGSTGDLNIEGWDQPTIDVQPEKAPAGITLARQVSGSETTLTFTHKRFTDGKVAYRIRVPRNTNLVIRHDTGAVVIFDVAGDIDATTARGDVAVQLPEPGKYEINAHTKLGGIYSDFPGVRHPHLSTGETLKPAAEGEGTLRHIAISVAIGGITIQKAAPLPLLSLN